MSNQNQIETLIALIKGDGCTITALLCNILKEQEEQIQKQRAAIIELRAAIIQLRTTLNNVVTTQDVPFPNLEENL